MRNKYLCELFFGDHKKRNNYSGKSKRYSSLQKNQQIEIWQLCLAYFKITFTETVLSRQYSEEGRGVNLNNPVPIYFYTTAKKLP